MSQTGEKKPSLSQMLDPEYLANPYPLYHQLRSLNPVLWDEGQGGIWVVTGHEEVMTSLRDQRFSAQRMNIGTDWVPEDLKAALEPPIYALTRQMLFLDPPDHTRLRGLVSRAFTPRMIERLRPRIQQIVDELLMPARTRGRVEIINEFAYPLPAIVIAEMLGVPPEDRDRFTIWTDQFGQLLSGSSLTYETLISSLQGVSEFMEYFRAIISRQRNEPKENLIQAMLDAEEQGDTLSESEILGNCVLLLAAGHGTTTHLIGNGLLALLRHPEQMEHLRADSTLLPGAVAELLRYDSPVQMTSRAAKENLRIRDIEIQAGQEVLFVLGAANHDPAQFTHPDTLDVCRPENRQMAFGQGIHFCLGAPLARVEAEIAFGTFLRNFANPRLENETVEWFPSQVFRGLSELPVSL
ncbi:MAG TPA: cytochrome P450 [Ktedonobacteraceae bacterium]|nr:cytochrome P450 [Ktedonobacteraceae bacterium]